jgi:hypothetical protein
MTRAGLLATELTAGHALDLDHGHRALAEHLGEDDHGHRRGMSTRAAMTWATPSTWAPSWAARMRSMPSTWARMPLDLGKLAMYLISMTREVPSTWAIPGPAPFLVPSWYLLGTRICAISQKPQ